MILLESFCDLGLMILQKYVYRILKFWFTFIDGVIETFGHFKQLLLVL
jgi:hypothetical protein